MNWVRFITQFPVLFWASSLSLGLHGLVLMMPVAPEPMRLPILPLQPISLIPLSPNLKFPTSQIPIQPTPVASPSTSSPPNPSVPSEIEEATRPNPNATSPGNPIDQNSNKQEPTKQKPTTQESTSPKKEAPVPEKPKIEENSEQFSARIQTALTQVTGKLGQQYGDRFAERSDTIAASPELFFTQPELFYDNKGTPRSGLDKPFQIEKATPESVFEAFKINLKESGFTALLVENYGGGLLYEIKSKKEDSSERVAFYLSLLSLPDKSGTIVVIWKTRPQK